MELREARHVGAARGVHGDVEAEIPAAAAQVGRIDQPGSGRVQLGHKGVATPPAKVGLEAPAVVGKSVECVLPVT